MPRPLIDLSGQKFGRWTVLRRADENKPSGTAWVCRCLCGVERSVAGTNLKNGQSTNCGCERLEKIRAASIGRTSQPNAFIDLTGHTFGRWLVLQIGPKVGKTQMWSCVCECGAEKQVSGLNLRHGRSRSCGCLHAEKTSEAVKKHGLIDHPIYRTWQCLKNRCMNPAADDYKHYGARGISVAPEWLDFRNFWRDVASQWSPGLTIERVDVNGNYEPGNVRWASWTEQARNKRTNVVLDTPWGRITAAEASEKSGIDSRLLLWRHRRGWPAERLFQPVKSQTRDNPD